MRWYSIWYKLNLNFKNLLSTCTQHDIYRYYRYEDIKQKPDNFFEVVIIFFKFNVVISVWIIYMFCAQYGVANQLVNIILLPNFNKKMHIVEKSIIPSWLKGYFISHTWNKNEGRAKLRIDFTVVRETTRLRMVRNWSPK